MQFPWCSIPCSHLQGCSHELSSCVRNFLLEAGHLAQDGQQLNDTRSLWGIVLLQSLALQAAVLLLGGYQQQRTTHWHP